MRKGEWSENTIQVLEKNLFKSLLYKIYEEK